jgi:outer membrane lipoprotein
MRTVVLLWSVLALVACVRPPLDVAGEFSRITVRDAQDADRTGERVRWGGTIVETRPQRDRTCIEVVSLPLDRRARPRESDQSPGRFLACASGFYDPEIHARGREVTVVGTIEETRAGKVDEYDYVFPVVRAEAIHLWPEREERDVHYGVGVGPYWSPYWWGWWEPAPYSRRPPIVHPRR